MNPKKEKILIIAGIFFLVLILATSTGYYFWNELNKPQKTNNHNQDVSIQNNLEEENKEQIEIDFIVKELRDSLNKFKVIHTIERDGITIYLISDGPECHAFSIPPSTVCYLLVSGFGSSEQEKKIKFLKKINPFSIYDSIYEDSIKINKIESRYGNEYFLEYNEGGPGDGPASFIRSVRINLKNGIKQILSEELCEPDVNERTVCERTIYSYDFDLNSGDYEFVKKCSCSYDKNSIDYYTMSWEEYCICE